MWLTRSGVNDRLLGVCHNIALIVAANILPKVIFLLAAEPFSPSFNLLGFCGMIYYMEGCVVLLSVGKQKLELSLQQWGGRWSQT